MAETVALHLFSDEEGMAPMRGAANIPQGLTFDDQGVLVGVLSGHRAAFLGDTMDHGPLEMSILDNLIRLSDEENATLIAGNRDINKIRLIHELKMDMKADFAPTNIAAIVTFFDRLSDHDLKRLEYVHTAEEFETRFQAWGKGADAIKAELASKQVYHEDAKKMRISAIYNMTFGTFDVVNNKINELVRLDLLTEGQAGSWSDQRKAALVTAVHSYLAGGMMGMTGADDVGGDGYKNLYLRYLLRAKIASVERVGSKKVLVTHGGVGDVFTNPLGVVDPPKTSFSTSVHEPIEAANRDFAATVQRLFDSRGKLDDAAAGDIEYYMNMLSSVTATAKNGVRVDASRSPVVDRRMILDPSRFTESSRYVAGGAGADWTSRYNGEIKAFDTTGSADGKDEGNRLDYVVFGHTPQGPAPTVWFSADQKTVFAGIDVSKAPGHVDGRGVPRNPAEYGTFAIMTITDDGFEISGRVNVDPGSKAVLPTQYALYEYKNTHGDYLQAPYVPGHNFKYNVAENHLGRGALERKTPLYHRYVGFNSEYATGVPDNMEDRAIASATDLLMIASNGSGSGFDYGLVDEFLRKSGDLFKNKQLLIGFDGDPPGSIPANIVSKLVGDSRLKVAGVVQMQGRNAAYGLPNAPREFKFAVPLVTLMYHKSDESPDRPDHVHQTVDIGQSRGLNDGGAYGGFEEDGAPKGSTAGWIQAFKAPPWAGKTRHFAAFWDGNVRTKSGRGAEYSGSITQQTFDGARGSGLVSDGGLVDLFGPGERGEANAGGGASGRRGLWACTGLLAFATLVASGLPRPGPLPQF